MIITTMKKKIEMGRQRICISQCGLKTLYFYNIFGSKRVSGPFYMLAQTYGCWLVCPRNERIPKPKYMKTSHNIGREKLYTVPSRFFNIFTPLNKIRIKGVISQKFEGSRLSASSMFDLTFRNRDRSWL